VLEPRRPLFDRYPGTRALPWTALGSLPTAVQRCDDLATEADAGSAWVKRDDLSGEAYGGNKVRKLEFLIGEALARSATDVITFGAAGSNHALATAIYGTAHGLKVHSLLMPQPNASYVRRNLLAATAVGADLRAVADRDGALRAAACLRSELRESTGREPLVVPFGGTSPASTAGFVNAGLELAEQVADGALPEPDLVFVALGSMGTAAGLALGLRAAGMRTRVAAVPVVADTGETASELVDAIRAAGSVLHEADATFPVFEWTTRDMEVVHGFLGEAYASFTPEGMEAVGVAKRMAGATVEGTYTGKTMAALLARGRSGGLARRNVLFWNTYNSRDLLPLVQAGRIDALPPGLRTYFETDVQELDRT
jgi:1-aminocyclopropane-1-carboxylate deaminase/D-cysteine desulfhydrase-like pyridoxal-dependent ACC family enzyme